MNSILGQLIYSPADSMASSLPPPPPAQALQPNGVLRSLDMSYLNMVNHKAATALAAMVQDNSGLVGARLLLGLRHCVSVLLS